MRARPPPQATPFLLNPYATPFTPRAPAPPPRALYIPIAPAPNTPIVPVNTTLQMPRMSLRALLATSTRAGASRTPRDVFGEQLFAQNGAFLMIVQKEVAALITSGTLTAVKPGDGARMTNVFTLPGFVASLKRDAPSLFQIFKQVSQNPTGPTSKGIQTYTVTVRTAPRLCCLKTKLLGYKQNIYYIHVSWYMTFYIYKVSCSIFSQQG